MAMTLFPWERAPFFSNPGLLEQQAQTTLPFSVGALSRKGAQHVRHGMNNQDAIQVIVRDKCIIGILCDGTSSTHPYLERYHSNNEVGAHLISYLMAESCFDATRYWKGASPKTLIRCLDTSFRKRYRDLVFALSGRTRKGKITSHFLTSTCLGFIILEKEYFVFAAGDGIVHLNSNNIVLDTRLKFISGQLLSSRRSILKLVAHGNTNELNHIALLSDGFQTRKIYQHQSLISFLEKHGETPGFSDISSSFHTEVLNDVLDETRKHWPQDDASFIVARRIQDETP